MLQTSAADARGPQPEPKSDPSADFALGDQPLERVIARLETEMLREARALRFEAAASLRDRVEELRARLAAQGA